VPILAITYHSAVKVKGGKLLTKRCPECGADNRDDAIYCSSCGIQMAVPPPVPTVLPVMRPAPPPRMPPPTFAPPMPAILPLPPPPRPIWGTLITLAAGILVMVGVIAGWVYAPSSDLDIWFLKLVLPGLAWSDWMRVATVIALILSFSMFLAGFLMYQGYGTFGGIIGFLCAVLSISIGGGLLAGFTLGIIGAFLAIMRK
jgi:hypothetical protein